MILAPPAQQNPIKPEKPKPTCENNNLAQYICVNKFCGVLDKLVCESQECKCQNDHANCELIQWCKLLQTIKEKGNIFFHNNTQQWISLLKNQYQLLKQKIKTLEQNLNCQYPLYSIINHNKTQLFRLIQLGKVKTSKPIGFSVMKSLQINLQQQHFQNKKRIEQMDEMITAFHKQFDKSISFVYQDISKAYFQFRVNYAKWFQQQIHIDYPCFIEAYDGLKETTKYLKDFKNLQINNLQGSTLGKLHNIFINVQEIKVKKVNNSLAKQEEIFSNFKSLKRLSVQLANLNRNKINQSTLQEIQLHNCHIGQNILKSLALNSPHLKKIYLSPRLQSKCKQDLLLLLKSLKHLQNLQLNNITLSQSGIRTICTSLPKLNTLIYNTHITDQHALFFSSIPNLDKLHIYINLSNDGSSILFKSFPNLKILKLHSSQLKNHHIMHISNNIQSLQQIKIQTADDNDITDTYIRYLSKLRHLKNISRLKFNSSKNITTNYYGLLFNLKQLSTNSLKTLTNKNVLVKRQLFFKRNMKVINTDRQKNKVFRFHKNN